MGKNWVLVCGSGCLGRSACKTQIHGAQTEKEKKTNFILDTLEFFEPLQNPCGDGSEQVVCDDK